MLELKHVYISKKDGSYVTLIEVDDDMVVVEIKLNLYHDVVKEKFKLTKEEFISSYFDDLK